MGSTVEIIKHGGGPYTWADNGGMTWNSPASAERNWVTAADPAVFTLDVVTTLELAEVGARNSAKNLAESFQIAESIDRLVGKNLSEALVIAETMERAATFIRDFAEALSLAEADARTVGKSLAEMIGISDKLHRTADAVISDILVGQGDVSAQQFQTLLDQAHAVGYGPFKPFMEGDHEYQAAIVKAALTAMSGSRPRLEELKMTVDVPDVIDGGTVNTSAAGLVTVDFNRVFHVVPEVTATLKGGTVFAVPRIHNITTASFDVELVNSSNARVAGSVSWSAKGY